MDFERADGPLARAFERELKRHHGRIGATEIALGYTRGHFRRLFRQKLPIKTDLILRAVEALGVDPREFFARAYDISLIPEHLLGLHARPGRIEPGLRKIEKAVLRLETGNPPEGSGLQARDFHPRLETYWRAGAGYQRKHLGKTKMFRQPAFVTEYLERLDTLRYERPKDAAKIAAGVVTILLPLVPADREEIIGFACKAIGIYASGHRQSLGFETAAAAIVMGLRLAGRHGLELARAELMQRGAYVLSDHGEFDRALLLLYEAHVTYSDHKSEIGVAKTIVERATMFGHKGRHSKALDLFKDAFNRLPTDADAERYRMAAMDGITISYRKLGDLESAEEWLREAIETYGETGDVMWGKIIWQAAVIAYEKHNHTRAERLLAKTRDIFEEKGNPIQAGLAALDHASVLLAQGKQQEACELAVSMASLLKPFQYNPFAEGAITEFLRAGLNGCITQDLIDKTADQIEEGVPETGHALFKAASSRPVRYTAPRPPAPSKGRRRPGTRGPNTSSRT